MKREIFAIYLKIKIHHLGVEWGFFCYDKLSFQGDPPDHPFSVNQLGINLGDL